MAPTESYIVRIYRRGRKNSRLIAGGVEKVGGDTRKAGFENIEELSDILSSHGPIVRREAHDRESGKGKT